MSAALETNIRDCIISLVFGKDHIPHPADIFELANADGNFFVSHDLRSESDPINGLELLAAGLTFDCLWSDTTIGPAAPDKACRFGIPEDADLCDLEEIRLMVGANLSGGRAALPLAQEALVLAARFSVLPGFVAAVWRPARSWIGPAYLASIATNWSKGGIFPARGLIGLSAVADGAIHSEGLAFFIGQELRLEAELLGQPSIAESIAIRLVDQLIGSGKVDAPRDIMGPDSRLLRVVPSSNGQLLRVWGG